MPLSEWLVGLLEAPHELYEYGLTLCGLLLLSGFAIALLRKGPRGPAPANPSYALRYKRHLHREYQRATLQRRGSSRRLGWRRHLKPAALLIAGALLLFGWLARNDGAHEVTSRSNGVVIRRGTTIASSPGAAGGGAFYPTCSAARAAGAAPITAGAPGYRSALDEDSDGVACEPWP